MHAGYFSLVLLIGIIALAMSASVVAYQNEHGAPGGGIQARVRILLVASVWTVVIVLYLLVGVILSARSWILGILVHFVLTVIGFFLYLIGAATVTSFLRSHEGLNFPRRGVVHGLEIVSWIETVLLFILLPFIIGVGLKSRESFHRATLV